jgi:hypothetical protein
VVNWSTDPGGIVVVVLEASAIVVVVVVGAGQLGPLPGAGQASQQLVHAPAIPFLAAQDVAFLVLHLIWPFAFVMQQVTKFGLPQTDFAAHFLTAPLHVLGRKSGSEGSRAARTLAIFAAHAT